MGEAAAAGYFGPTGDGGSGGGAAGFVAGMFGTGDPTQAPPPNGLTAEAQAKAFVEALSFIERHQAPVSRRQAAGWVLLRQLDPGHGRYAGIVDQAERLRLWRGGPEDFVNGLQAIALAARPRLMSAMAPRPQRPGMFARMMGRG